MTEFKAVSGFFVEGLPKAQPRPRFFKGHAYNPGTADDWKEAITIAAREHWKEAPLSGPVALSIALLHPKAKTSTAEWMIKKPDIDNLVKAVMDALTTAKVWYDDAQVVSLNATKGYGQGDKIGAFIQIGKGD